MADQIKYKKPTNPNRPGRPPKGCKWVRAKDGGIESNDKGELGYRPLTAAEIAAAGKKKSKTKSKAKSKARAKNTTRRSKKKTTTAAKSSSGAHEALLRKGNYSSLSFEELTKISEWVTANINRRKASEKAAVAGEIKRLEAKLKILG